MRKKIENDEINLIEVIINIWNNKFKIAAITVIFITLPVALYLVIKPPLKAKTEIFPITIFENNLYGPYNALIAPALNVDGQEFVKQEGLANLDKDYFLSLFIEELRAANIIIEAIKKYQLIDQKKFNDEDDYLEEVEKYALKLDLLRPINVDGSQRGETRLNWIIEYTIDDKNKWEEALSFIEIEINNKIRKYLETNFKLSLNNLKMLEQFKIEDLNQKIKFVKNDYDIQTKNRLLFLKEQSLIARKLNIASNPNIINSSLEVQQYFQSSKVISNTETTNPYYLRGFDVIEKEIELIETRNNKDAFTQNLFDLEKQKRELLEDKSLERIEQLFNSTPIIKGNNFKAAEIIFKDTKYESSFSLIKVILFSGIFGIIFGMFYVLVSNSIQQRK